MLKKILVMESESLQYGNIRRNDLSELDKEEFEITSEKMKDKYKNFR